MVKLIYAPNKNVKFFLQQSICLNVTMNRETKKHTEKVIKFIKYIRNIIIDLIISYYKILTLYSKYNLFWIKIIKSSIPYTKFQTGKRHSFTLIFI